MLLEFGSISYGLHQNLQCQLQRCEMLAYAERVIAPAATHLSMYIDLVAEGISQFVCICLHGNHSRSHGAC